MTNKDETAWTPTTDVPADAPFIVHEEPPVTAGPSADGDPTMPSSAPPAPPPPLPRGPGGWGRPGATKPLKIAAIVVAGIFFLAVFAGLVTEDVAEDDGEGIRRTSNPPVVVEPLSTVSTSIGGRAMLGPLADALVQIHELGADGTKARLLATVRTNAEGYYLADVDVDPDLAILVEVTGGTYIDEATGASQRGPSEGALRAIAPDASRTWMEVNTLTTIAAQRALALADENVGIALAAQTSNAGLSHHFFIDDLLGIYAADATDLQETALANLEERRYGLLMAALSEQAHALGVTAWDLTSAYASDGADGVLDGRNARGPIRVGGVDLPADAATTGVAQAMDRFVAGGRNAVPSWGPAFVPSKVLTSTPVRFGAVDDEELRSTSPRFFAFAPGEEWEFPLELHGGSGDYTCASSGWPAGIRLGADCVLQGTVAEPESQDPRLRSPVRIRVEDASSGAEPLEFEAQVALLGSTPRIEGHVVDCVVAAPCDASVYTWVGGGKAPARFAFYEGEALPAGLSYRDGRIVGTATKTGLAYRTGCLYDALGASACATIAVRSSKPTPLTVEPVWATCRAAQACDLPLVRASGGLAPYTWTHVPSLPHAAGSTWDGLTYDGGRVKGTSQAAADDTQFANAVKVCVKDARGAEACTQSAVMVAGARTTPLVRITGRILDGKEEPLADARVLYYRSDNSFVGYTATNEAGEYAFDFPTALYFIHASHRPCHQDKAFHESWQAEPLDTVLVWDWEACPAELRDVTVLVTWGDGRTPIHGPWVQWTSSVGPYDGEKKTGADGKVRFHVPKDSPFKVTVGLSQGACYEKQSTGPVDRSLVVVSFDCDPNGGGQGPAPPAKNCASNVGWLAYAANHETAYTVTFNGVRYRSSFTASAQAGDYPVQEYDAQGRALGGVKMLHITACETKYYNTRP